MENLSPKQRADVIRIYHRNGDSCTRTRREALRELNVSLTDCQVRRLAKHLEERNTVDPKVLASRRGIAGRQRDEDNYNIVLVSLLEDRELSIRRRSLLLGIPRSSVQLIINKLGFHAYRMRRVHALQEGDYARRVEFCTWALQMKTNNPNFLYLLMMSDEAKFNICGEINSTNAYHYSVENEHIVLEVQMERRGVMAWAAMTANLLIGPFFFEENVSTRLKQIDG
ncbi:hypothetical protein B566_EDAN014049 [Ephemera danica]|nr:hypothetical protein B566_EDAN014049 [Ephemera danica]